MNFITRNLDSGFFKGWWEGGLEWEDSRVVDTALTQGIRAVCPLLEKPYLNPALYENYYLVSNLPIWRRL